MKTISKRFRFGQAWEILMVDGEIHFLAKDILHYFGYSETSQGTLRNSINESDIQIISGEHVKHLKGDRIRAMIVSKPGLVDFIMSRDPERFEKGKVFLKWVNESALPEMNKKWNDKTKKENKTEQANLFGDTNDRDIDDLKSVVKIQSERIDNLEKMIKEIQETRFTEEPLTEDGREQMIISGLIEKLTGMTQSRGVK